MILTTMLYVWAANAAMIFCFRFRYPISLLVNIFSTNYSVCSIKKDCEVHMYLWFSSVQSLSRVRLFATPWIAARQASLSITNSQRWSNSWPSSQWCHPAISSSVVPFSSCPQSLPASGSFPMSQLFAWGGQSIGVSASASVLPMNTHLCTYGKSIRVWCGELNTKSSSS